MYRDNTPPDYQKFQLRYSTKIRSNLSTAAIPICNESLGCIIEILSNEGVVSVKYHRISRRSPTMVIHSSRTTGEAGGELDRIRASSPRIGEPGGESTNALGEVIYNFLGDRNFDDGLDRVDVLLKELCLGG